MKRVVLISILLLSPAGAAPSSKPTTTSEEYRIVDPVDLYVGSKKYLDKPVLLRKLHCYYADVSDYRCVADDTQLAVFAKTIEPQAARDWVEKNCDQIKKVPSTKCVFNVEFSYGSDDVDEDLTNGYQRRKIIRPTSGGVTMVPSKKVHED